MEENLYFFLQVIKRSGASKIIFASNHGCTVKTKAKIDNTLKRKIERFHCTKQVKEKERISRLCRELKRERKLKIVETTRLKKLRKIR